MIITKTPFRITLGGGGTDLPEFYEKYGGFILAAAIDKYMYVAVNRPKTDTLIHIKSRNFSQSVECLDEVTHDLAREILRDSGMFGNIDVSSVSDIDAGTGLGSSSCYAVGLYRAFGPTGPMMQDILAEDDYRIERGLGRSIGKQDPYMAAYGGLQAMFIGEDGKVEMTRMKLLPEIKRKLNKNLMLFFTGVTRSADTILSAQASGDMEHYKEIKRIGLAIKDALIDCRLDDIGLLFDEHWEQKKKTVGVSNEIFDEIYEIAKKNGALGGKISGAGGGGFFLFYVPREHRRFTEKMECMGLKWMPYKFVEEGSEIIYHD